MLLFIAVMDSDFPAGSAQAAAYFAAQGKLVNPYSIPVSGPAPSPLAEPTHPAHRLHRLACVSMALSFFHNYLECNVSRL